MRSFDFYEFAGVFVPGAVLCFAILLFVGGTPASEVLQSPAGAALLVVAAYATGHLIQLAGNGLEVVWWIGRGMPSDWPRRKDVLITARVREELDRRYGMRGKSRAEWKLETRRLIGAVHAAGLAGRLERFNGNYGLLRGTAAALVVAVAVGFVLGDVSYRTGGLLMVAAFVALLRMERFGRRYAEELLNRAVELPE